MHIAVAAGSVLASHVVSGESSGNSGSTGWSSIIGIVTAIIGNILISFALNTQRYAHVRLEREHNEKRGLSLNPRTSDDAPRYGAVEQSPPDGQPKAQQPAGSANGIPLNDAGSDQDQSGHMQESFRSDDTLRPAEKDEDGDDGRESYLKSPIWWLGIVMMTIGETGNFLAYGFAPASIVSPLGVVALISNCLIAPLMLKEKFRKRDFFGVLIAIAGAVTVVLSAKQSETRLNPDELWNYYIKRWEFLVYVIVTFIAIIGLTIASPKYGKRTILVDIGLVGLYGGYTALSTKGVASLLSAELWKAFAFPIFYVLVLILVGSAVMQIRYLNKALQNFDSTQVIPTQFVVFTLSVIIGSAVLYRDFESTTPDRAIKFVTGCLLTFFGVYLITSHRASGDESEEDGFAEQDETIRFLNEETEDVDERTPLKVDTARRPSHLKHESLSATPRGSLPQTPPRSPSLRADVPSIAVSPASAGTPISANPWRSSVEQLPPASDRPYTPNRSVSDLTGTPFYTPATSRPLQRSQTSSADPETPTRAARTGSPPKPDRSAVLAAEEVASPTFRSSARNSISRLIPGPLLPPLSSSLSGIVAESLRRGEGSSLLVRQRLRRSRLRSGTVGRRRSIAPGDEESGLGSNEEFGRSTTRSTLPPGLSGGEGMSSGPDVRDVVEGEGDLDQKKSRLRSMSETFSSMLGGKGRGKSGEDDVNDGTGGGVSLNR
jgi:magnesium transporter